MSPPDPDVSVVMVTWNSAAVVGPCIESLDAGLGSLSWELVVVDNASRDGTVETVRRLSPRSTLVANTRNLGLAAANNQGIAESHGRYVLISNPDVVFAPGSVSEMVAVMRRHPAAGWVVPRLLREDGSLHTSAGDLPTLAEALLGRQAAGRRSAGEARGFWWDGWHHRDEREVGRGHEASYLVRRETIESVGPQDERYRLDWEGVDWADRMRRAGWEIWLAPNAEVVHLGGASIREVPFRWIFSQHRGMYLYFSDRSRRRGARPLLRAAFGARAVLKAAGAAAGAPLYELSHRAGDKARRAG